MLCCKQLCICHSQISNCKDSSWLTGKENCLPLGKLQNMQACGFFKEEKIVKSEMHP
jgi:hypothetical protein